MSKYLLILLTAFTLTGCSLSSPPPATNLAPTLAPSSVTDTSQQLLQDLDTQASFDFESEFDNLETDLF